MATSWSFSAGSGSGKLPWLARSPLGQGILLFGTVLVLLVLIPLGALALLFGIAAAGWIALRRGLDRLRRPNGALDGRRNVRVVIRDSGTDE